MNSASLIAANGASDYVDVYQGKPRTKNMLHYLGNARTTLPLIWTAAFREKDYATFEDKGGNSMQYLQTTVEESLQDLNGRNIFRVTLERLGTLQELADAQYGDVLAFARGECHERLGQWKQAVTAFEAAAARATSLAEPARRRADAARKLGELTDRSKFTPTLEAYLNDLDVLERRLKAWLDEKPPYPYPSYLRQAMERAQEERVRLLFMNHLVVEGAVARSIQAGQRLVSENKESWRASDHSLLLGSLFETLAHEIVAQQPPEGADFKADQGWSTWIEQARQAYRRVAQTDGDPAKLEGQARLRALDAYAQRILALGR